MNIYHCKLIAILAENQISDESDILARFQCFATELNQVQNWWEDRRGLLEEIAQSSDRVNLQYNDQISSNGQAKHPISGQSQEINTQLPNFSTDTHPIAREPDAEKVFWWFWRFYPELQSLQQPQALLVPAHQILPDCPQHSYRATVSALVSATLNRESQTTEHPHLLLFTFSPVQEFIKASRKFLDFWAGSYLLHYLSARLCWHVASKYGPDAVITPSLWGQEIIDAFILQKYPDFADYFSQISPEQLTPVQRFNEGKSTSLSTAGFPNFITALLPGKEAATALGKELVQILTQEWTEIGQKVRSHIRDRVIEFLRDTDSRSKFLEEFIGEMPEGTDSQPYERDLNRWETACCWEWKKLWDAQLSHTWETYWSVIPLGHPEKSVRINKDDRDYELWKKAQSDFAQPRWDMPTPTSAEQAIYNTLNVGTWWGALQARLGQSIKSVKNTRTWKIPCSPGERSTLSGQFSAAHPQLNYIDRFREGGGISAGSMRLFWRLMAKVYPGLFNGSEKLNCLEISKRMSWQYGGVAQSLGISTSNLSDINLQFGSEDANALDAPSITATSEIYYERLIRFPNLSSIASARFVHDNFPKVREYWRILASLIKDNLPEYKQKFASRTRGRSLQIPKTDAFINPDRQNGGDYNGVMFSSKWLAEDMGLQGEQTATLRNLVEQAHKASGLSNGSPADWWVIVLADGDGMGKYVSGEKLKNYEDYIILPSRTDLEKIAENLGFATVEEVSQLIETGLCKTRKRMGPATHVGLNRALIDFSNRLVPHITEKRCCGKVVYSGGDDVMAVLPLEDLPNFLLSLRAAWCGENDPGDEFDSSNSGYWYPRRLIEGLPNRPHFTMGKGATMSMGIVIAYKSIPLPTVLENLWEAEKERAKKIPGKDGLCFRVIYGGGNTLEALMKGSLLESWLNFLQPPNESLSPLLYRLAEELPRRAEVTANNKLFHLAAKVIMESREESKRLPNFPQILSWLDNWENWAYEMTQNIPNNGDIPLGTKPEDLGKILRFSAFWVDKMVQRQQWVEEES